MRRLFVSSVYKYRHDFVGIKVADPPFIFTRGKNWLRRNKLTT